MGTDKIRHLNIFIETTIISIKETSHSLTVNFHYCIFKASCNYICIASGCMIIFIFGTNKGGLKGLGGRSKCKTVK
jgi:hypothetical protein